MTLLPYKRLLAGLLLFAGMTLSINSSSAVDPTCPDSGLFGTGLVTNICWDCLFPMYISGAKTGSGNVPNGASTSFLCACDDLLGTTQIGVHLGLWTPARLIEVVRAPYCSPSLGGTKIQNGVRLQGGKQTISGDMTDSTFYNYHYFAFPLLIMMDMLLPAECNSGGFRDFDLMYLSELDPSWSDDELAMLLNPEAAVFANPVALAACAFDCANTTMGNPSDNFYYCAGCWGHLYPFTGRVTAANSPPAATSLLATRAVAALHRRGLAWRTVGDANQCGGSIYPTIPKTQYKMSTLYPLAEASSSGNKVLCDPSVETCSGPGGAAAGTNPLAGLTTPAGASGKCCHDLGESAFRWGEWRNIPGIGEDFLYLLFRYQDCCMN